MPELQTERSEDAQMQGWNFEKMFELGLTVSQAERLSQAGVSHHEVEDLLNAGCPSRLVSRILRPLKETKP